MDRREITGERISLPRWTTTLALFLGVSLVGCDTGSLLEVKDPDVASPTTLTDSTAIPFVTNGALGDLQWALNGADGAVTLVGLFTDEFVSAGTFTTRAEVDRRNINYVTNSETEDLFRDLQVARVSGLRAQRLSEQFLGETNDPRAMGLIVEGYAELMLAENFCSGVPFSEQTPEGQDVYGPPQTTAEVYAAALGDFDAAITAAVETDLANLARVGRARTLLNLGRFDEAAATAADVPTEFVWLAEYSANSTAQENYLWDYTSNGRWSVANYEGGAGDPFVDPATGASILTEGEGLPFLSAMDPRVPWFYDGIGFDEETPLFFEQVQPGRAADVPLATGIEARLIEAEVALRSGDAPHALTLLNGLRANSGTLLGLMGIPAVFDLNNDGEPDPQVLAPLEGPVTVETVFAERAFWMYATAHRLGDLRRLIRQYGFAADEVFPSGDYFKGRTYGEDVNFPITFKEENNPEFTGSVTNGCIDRDA